MQKMGGNVVIDDNKIEKEVYMTDKLRELRRLGHSIWFDNIRRAMLTNGEFEKLIAAGVLGVTSNPTIFEKATDLNNCT